MPHTTGRWEPFKACPSCRHEWQTRNTFLADKEIRLTGYQADFEDLATGLLLFNHRCGTTLAIPVAEFRDLYSGPVFEEQLTGTDQCPEYCLRQDELAPCDQPCECAFVREIMQIIQRWPESVS